MSRTVVRALAFACLLLALPVASAAGPASVAVSDRSLWPDALDDTRGFDRASRAEILVFAQALQKLGAQGEADFEATTGVKTADMQSVARVRDRLLDAALANFKAASGSCVPDELLCAAVDSRAELVSVGQPLLDKLPDRYKAWRDDATAFHQRYVAELLRLAALFPKVTSEIDTFSGDERNGFELPDRHFLLTFDDGPANPGGDTEATLRMLATQHLHGMFFLLGERLQSRLHAQDAATLRQLYQDQCLALHGWQHQSHQHWDQWQKSVLDTQALVKRTFEGSYRPYFRPPYGQRRDDSGPFFKANGLTVVLWNIDSQDWNAKISAQQSANRVMSLMLLWRRGLILFHDIHPKAQLAVPWLLEKTRASGITWDDCRSY